MAGQQDTDRSGLKKKRSVTERKIRRDKEKTDTETEGKQTDGDSAAVTPHLTLEPTEVMSTIYHPLTPSHTHAHTTRLLCLPCQAQQDDALIPLGVKVSVHSICPFLPSSCHPAPGI